MHRAVAADLTKHVAALDGFISTTRRYRIGSDAQPHAAPVCVPQIAAVQPDRAVQAVAQHPLAMINPRRSDPPGTATPALEAPARSR